MVALFVLSKTSEGSSCVVHGSGFASLTVKILGSVRGCDASGVLRELAQAEPRPCYDLPTECLCVRENVSVS